MWTYWESKIGKKSDTMDYDFWGTKIKSFQFVLAFWASATDLGASPRLSPEKTPKIISYTTNYYKQLCNQLIFAINHLFRFIPRATEHPPGWSLHHRIVLSKAFQMVLHSFQSGENWWSYGLDGFGITLSPVFFALVRFSSQSLIFFLLSIITER